MHALKITQIGNSVGVILPKEVLVKLNVQKGDTIYLTDAPDGLLNLSGYSDEVARQVALGEDIMNDYKDTFRALAK
jgi:putative addiction module antidote